MYLSNIKLWNFRKFGKEGQFDLEKPDLDLNFTNGLNVFIGENDTGKTAIIDAIKLVLKTHSYEKLRITQEDFFANQDRLRIELKFIDLLDNEAKNFTEWLGWEGSGKHAKPYLRLIYDVRRKIEDPYIYPADVRAGVDETGYPLTAEAREYLKVTYLKPLRDAYGELVPRRNSRLSQILMGHEAFKGKNEDHILVKQFETFNKSVEEYFEHENESESECQKGKELKNEIDKFIHSFYSNEKESNFTVTEGNLKSILEKLELTIKDEINPGLGTLNRLFMAVELVHLQKKNWNGIRLGLIEELEAHIHPQAQMQIIESLQKEKNIQLILTTHSPNLGSKVKLENLILCTNNYVFPLGNEYTELDEKDYKFLERFLDTTKANLFFAKGVIFVEGWSEEILLPALARKLKKQGVIDKDLTESGISIVNIGNTAFLHYSRIYLRKEELFLDIPVAIVTDIDLREYVIDDNGNIISNDITQEQKKSKIEEIKKRWERQSVKVFVTPNWTLEYALYKSTSLSQNFKEIFKIIHPQIDEENYEVELAKKLINKRLKKTEIAYKLAQEIETNDDIEIDENDEPIKYLIEAIKYVSND